MHHPGFETTALVPTDDVQECNFFSIANLVSQLKLF